MMKLCMSLESNIVEVAKASLQFDWVGNVYTLVTRVCRQTDSGVNCEGCDLGPRENVARSRAQNFKPVGRAGP